MDFQTIKIKKINHKAIIMLNRPQSLNAISKEMLTELQQAVSLMNSDLEVHAVIIGAEGSKVFSVGGDIKEEVAMDAEESRKWSAQGQKLTESIENSSKPYIAAIHGHTVGAGCEISIACDFIIAADDTLISAPAIKLGMICGFGANVRLPKLIGKIKAKEMLMIGSSIDAQEAYRLGLVNKVVPKDDLLDAVLAFTDGITNKSSATLALAKRAINYGVDATTVDAIENERTLFVEAAKLEDKKEGMMAFLEKRPPQFTGK